MNEFQSSGVPTQVGSPGETALSPSPRGRGATAVEYALMVTLIAMVIIGAVALFGQSLIHLFNVPASAL